MCSSDLNLVERMIRPIDMPRNLIGYYDDENFYFESDAAYVAVIYMLLLLSNLFYGT